MKLSYKTAGLVCCLAILFASCKGTNGGEKFIGTWKLVYDPKGPDAYKVDERRGNFIIDKDTGGHYRRHWANQPDYFSSFDFDAEKNQLVYEHSGSTEFFRYDDSSKHYFIGQSGADGNMLMQTEKVK